jgi:hypothetical protein
MREDTGKHVARTEREENCARAIADTPHVTQSQHPSLRNDHWKPKKKSMKLVHGEVTGKLHEKIKFSQLF